MAIFLTLNGAAPQEELTSLYAADMHAAGVPIVDVTQPSNQQIIDQTIDQLYEASGALELARDMLSIANKLDLIMMSRADTEMLDTMVAWLDALHQQKRACYMGQ